MQIEEIFYILGIEQTKDEKVIKDAYRKKLMDNNPEDDPEGFKKLREAYEEACSYAKSEEEEQIQERDESPSGLWVEKAVALYSKLSTRCDAQLWQELFHEEIFVSLDGYEECRRKLLIFMMNHFSFSDDVWKLIEKNLSIKEDSGKLKEEFPADFIDFLVRRCMMKEAIDYTLFEGPDDADYDTYIRCYNAAWDCLQDKDYKKLEELLGQAQATGVSHPYMELVRAGMYRDTQETGKAQEILERLHEKYPADTTVLYQLAEFYWETKLLEKAADCYAILKEHDNEHYMANYRLAFWYTQQEDFEAARDCIRLVMRRGHDDAMLELRLKVNHKLEQKYQGRWQQEQDIDAAIELAWCYLQDERYLAAAKLVEEMSESVPNEKRSEWLGLAARIYMGQGKHEKAMETSKKWQKFLEKTTPPEDEEDLKEYRRDIEIAHRISMSSYHMMGRGFKRYYDNALEEYEFLKNKEMPDPNILIDAARIYLEKEDYQKCLDLADILMNRYQVRYAYALMLEAYVKLWDAGGVIRSATECIHYFPDYARPYEESAKVYYDLNQPDKLKEILDLAKQNDVESVYLEAYALPKEEIPKDFPIGQYMENFKSTYARTLETTGKLKYYQDGYPIITKYFKMYPCHYILNTRGLFSMAAKDYEAALKDFRKILERDPADQFALNNIGCVLKYTGQYEQALPYFENAFYYMYREGKEEVNAMPLGNMAHTYELMGEYALAAITYQRLIDDNSAQKESLISMKDLSSNYARSGQINMAIKILDTYMKARSEYCYLIYRAYLYAADWVNADKAYESFMKQIEYCYSGSAEQTAKRIDCEHMRAWQCMRLGKYEEAIQAMNNSLELSHKNVAISAKLRADLLANKLFFLFITQVAQGKTVKTMTPQSEPQAEAKETLLAKFTKFFNGGKKQEEARPQEKEAISPYAKEGRMCAEELDKFLNNLCREQLAEGKKRDAIQTKEFFYKERYVKYLEFMVALFTGSEEDVLQALDQMEKSNRCRLCNHGQCMRYTIARALYEAYQGDRQEAGEICAALLQRQPYNLYAYCGVNLGEKRS